MPLTRVDSFASLARELATKPTLAATLQAIVETAAANIAGAEHAAITVKRGEERYQTVASTGQLPLDVAAIQYRLSEGPCPQALELHHVFRSDELGTDPRWPRFGREAAARPESSA